MRELLAWIDDALRADRSAWHGRGAASLRSLILRLRAFDTATHRPKGVALLAALRGRSAPVDELLDRLETDRETCDRLLSQALALLDDIERGDERAVADCTTVLQRHGGLMRSHLDCEDTLLRSHTAQLLTPEQWAAVASSISSVVPTTRTRAGEED